MLNINNKEYIETDCKIYNKMDNIIVNYIDSIYEKNDLPKNITISTMCLSGHTNVLFNLNNILKYLEPSIEDIISIKGNICEELKIDINDNNISEEVNNLYNIKDNKLYTDGIFSENTKRILEKTFLMDKKQIKKKQSNIKKTMIIKCIPEYQNKFKSTNKNINKSFYNQLTLIIKVKEDVTMHIKLFNNGAIQIAGCKSFDDCNIALNKLINKLSKSYIYFDDNEELIEINFMTYLNDNKLKLLKLQVDMINSNFSVNYLINRENLYNLLNSNKINCRYDPSSHAGVNIKYDTIQDRTNIVSIFVFQTGKIIITGAKKLIYIMSAYNFIHEFLQKNKKIIMKKDINIVLNNDNKKIFDKQENIEEIENLSEMNELEN